MTKHLADGLVHLPRRAFAEQGTAVLGLDHVEGGLDVAPPVVVRPELPLPEPEEMVHLGPRGVVVQRGHDRVALERHVGDRPF